MTNIICYKSTGNQREREYALFLNGNESLAEVRSILEKANFLSKDDKSAHIGYRFFYQSKKTDNINYADLIIPLTVEEVVSFAALIPPLSNQLIITNIYAKENPDLIGFNTDCWSDGFLTVNCYLNQHDEDAKINNAKMFEPMMLSNVISTQAPEKGSKSIPLNNVCVCCEGSIVDFELMSWGAAGYSFRAYPGAGEKIIEDLYASYDENNYNKCCRTIISRYEKHKNTIKIVGTDSLKNIVPGAEGSYQKVTFQSRRMTLYYEDKKKKHKHANYAEPPSLEIQPNENKGLLNSTIVTASIGYLPGTSIKPGAPIPEGNSNTVFGTIWDVETDGWDKALGTVDVYFFVFRTKADAYKVINVLNSPTWK